MSVCFYHAASWRMYSAIQVSQIFLQFLAPAVINSAMSNNFQWKNYNRSLALPNTGQVVYIIIKQEDACIWHKSGTKQLEIVEIRQLCVDYPWKYAGFSFDGTHLRIHSMY